MTDITVPAWALVLIGVVFLPWLLFLTHKVNLNEKDIALNTANDIRMGGDLDKIYKAIDEQKKDTKEGFERLDKKFDQLLIQENTMFRQLFGNVKIQS